MLGSERLMAFVATTNEARAKQFYCDVLGLRLVSDDPAALVFDVAGTTLRVQKVRELTPVGHTVLGWCVPAIARAMEKLATRGVAFERYEFLEQDAGGVWTAPGGGKVAWFKDPDGNLLSLTELTAD